MNEYEIPHTEQGLKDFIRFAGSEIKRSESKVKKLKEMVITCKGKLAIILQQKENVCPEESTKERTN